jgi:hypothetical protein
MMLLPKTPRTRDRKHMERVAQLPCVICGRWPVHVHHIKHDRHSQRKASDTDTIPLCHSHHEDLHRNPGEWRRNHGADHSYLERVAEALRQMEDNTV